MFRAACERLALTRRQIDEIAQAVYLHARAGTPPPNPVAIALPGMRPHAVSSPRLWVSFEIRGSQIVLRGLSERPSD